MSIRKRRTAQYMQVNKHKTMEINKTRLIIIDNRQYMHPPDYHLIKPTLKRWEAVI